MVFICVVLFLNVFVDSFLTFKKIMLCRALKCVLCFFCKKVGVLFGIFKVCLYFCVVINGF